LISLIFYKNKGELRYTNAASDDKIRKSVKLGPVVEKELVRLLDEFGVMELSDRSWPRPDEVGLHELVVEIGKKRVHFTTNHVLSIGKLEDESLKRFHYAITDIKSFLNNLIAAHFKKKPL
jgi:hypothetical protein